MRLVLACIGSEWSLVTMMSSLWYSSLCGQGYRATASEIGRHASCSHQENPGRG